MDDPNGTLTSGLRKILVFRIGHLGDMTVALPALWSLREKFPTAKITFLTNVDSQNPAYVVADAVFPKKGLIDDWLFYPSNDSRVGLTWGYLKLLLEIRRGHFDVLFYLMPRDRTPHQIRRDVRFFHFAGIRKVLGAEFLYKGSLNRDEPRPLPAVDSESEFLLNSLSSEGFSSGSVELSGLRLTSNEKGSAVAWLTENCGGAFGYKRLIAVAPGAKWSSKIWDETRYCQVVSELIETHDVFPVVFGGPDDREKGDRLIARWERGANAAGVLDVRPAAAAIEHCTLYLGNDTGTMHLAAAVGVPCVAIFSAIDFPGRWYPLGEKNVVFRGDVECEGCLLSECPFENKCMDQIGTAGVLTACSELLESN